MRLLRIATALLACALLAPSSASAEALPLDTTLRLGRPARTVRVHAEAVEEGLSLRVAIGARESEQLVRARGITDLTTERIEVAPGLHVAILRGTGEGVSMAALLDVTGSTPRILWAERTDFHGDPGERTTGVISSEDRTGNGRPDILVAARREGTTLCGQEETLLLGRAYDPRQGSLRPVMLRRVSGDEAVAATATRESPGPSGAPLLRALSAGGVSSTAGHAGDDVTGLAPPRALVDGRTETFWVEGRGGPGAQEFAILRWTVRFPIRAFAITPSPTGDAAAQLGRPRTFWLVGDEGARIRVTLPEDAIDHPGERYWVVPPEPVAWRCVALVLDEAYAPSGTRPAAVHTAIAEVEAYTEFDWGTGIEGLVNILVTGGGDGDEAARLLSNLGSPAIVALAASWERLDERGRRRSVRVFADGTRRGAPEGIEGLGRAAMDDAEVVRQSALEALGTLGPPAARVLGRLVAEPAPVGDAAVSSLVRHPPSAAAPPLLVALSAEGGSERAALREGLARALASGDADALRALAEWIEGAPVSSLASAALGLASRQPTRALAEPLVASLVSRAERFEDRWRVMRAARELPAADAVDAWLSTSSAEAEEWMLRAAALEALDRRAAGGRVEAARRALDDSYPRVRIAAVRILDGLDESDGTLATMARRDSWPMVRAAAVDALFDRPAGREAVRQAIHDRSPRVRRAALVAATRGGYREAWALVRARLEDDDEWPQVTIAALHYVRDLCVVEAGPQVVGVLRRGLRPNAWAPDIDVAAVAADLAQRLGGETATEAAQIGGRAEAPASIRAAIERAADVGGCASNG